MSAMWIDEDGDEGEVPAWTLGDRLRKARLEVDGSVQGFADELAVGRNTITNYESDRTLPPRSSVMWWAHRTGVSFRWLLGELFDPAEYRRVAMGDRVRSRCFAFLGDALLMGKSQFAIAK